MPGYLSKCVHKQQCLNNSLRDSFGRNSINFSVQEDYGSHGSVQRRSFKAIDSHDIVPKLKTLVFSEDFTAKVIRIDSKDKLDVKITYTHSSSSSISTDLSSDSSTPSSLSVLIIINEPTSISASEDTCTGRFDQRISKFLYPKSNIKLIGVSHSDNTDTNSSFSGKVVLNNDKDVLENVFKLLNKFNYDHIEMERSLVFTNDHVASVCLSSRSGFSSELEKNHERNSSKGFHIPREFWKGSQNSINSIPCIKDMVSYKGSLRNSDSLNMEEDVNVILNSDQRVSAEIPSEFVILGTNSRDLKNTVCFQILDENTIMKSISNVSEIMLKEVITQIFDDVIVVDHSLSVPDHTQILLLDIHSRDLDMSICQEKVLKYMSNLQDIKINKQDIPQLRTPKFDYINCNISTYKEIKGNCPDNNRVNIQKQTFSPRATRRSCTKKERDKSNDNKQKKIRTQMKSVKVSIRPNRHKKLDNYIRQDTVDFQMKQLQIIYANQSFIYPNLNNVFYGQIGTRSVSFVKLLLSDDIVVLNKSTILNLNDIVEAIAMTIVLRDLRVTMLQENELIRNAIKTVKLKCKYLKFYACHKFPILRKSISDMIRTKNNNDCPRGRFISKIKISQLYDDEFEKSESRIIVEILSLTALINSINFSYCEVKSPTVRKGINNFQQTVQYLNFLKDVHKMTYANPYMSILKPILKSFRKLIN